MNYDIFISYAEADGDWVTGYLMAALEAAGINYCSEEDFRLGVLKLTEYERFVKQSRQILLILSPAYMTDQTREFIDSLGQFYGIETGTWPVIPLIRRPVKLPARLSQLTHLDATQPEYWGQAIERLCGYLNRQVPGATPQPECPYPGMVPFSKAQSDRFFGRDQEIEELIEKLRLSRFVTVIGPSGSGKSSLVYAGLIPRLDSTQRLGSGEWLILTRRPGETPLTTLELVLEGKVENPQTIPSLLERYQAQRLFLFIDQFEEVFTLAGTEAIPFQHQLLKLIVDANCFIVLTVRADFYSELMQSPLWKKIKGHRLEVVPLDDQGLRDAILKPADTVDVVVQPTLVERLVTDAAGEPGVLPFVQETLVMLWEKLEWRYLRLSAYEQLVLPRKAYGGMGTEKLTGLQVAMARRADNAIADLTDEQQVIARRIFLRLIQFGEGRADTRRQQRAEALRASGDRDDIFETTLQHLVDCRLLTSSGEEKSDRKVDIAHEALISGWKTLQNWIIERREAEQTRRRLSEKTAEWIRLGQGEGGLLDEVELLEAERWLNSPDSIMLGLGDKLQDLVRASRAAIEAAKQKEAEAQQRENDLLQEKLKHEQKARKATQKTFRVAVGLLAIASGIAVLAAWQWRQAERGEIVAQVETSKAKFSENRDTFDALILALEAGEKFQNSIWWRNDSELKAEVMEALTATVFWTKERNRIEGHDQSVESVAFSPDGSLLASGGFDNTVKLWKMSSQDGDQPLELTGHEKPVMAVAFSPDGKMIASVSQDKTLRLWTLTGEAIGDPIQHEDIIYAVDFSPNSQFIATGDRKGNLKLCNLQNRECETNPEPVHKGGIYSLSFSPKRNIIVSVGEDKNIILWEWNSNLALRPSPPILAAHEASILGVDFSPTDNIFATASPDESVKLWKLENNAVKATLFKTMKSSSDEQYSCIRFNKDGSKLAAGTIESSIHIWDKNQDWAEIEQLRGHRIYTTSVDFDTHGRLASANRDQTIRLWQLTTSFVKVLYSHKDTVTSVSLSPNGETLATASVDQTVKLWDTSGNLIETLKGHTNRVHAVTFSDNGNFLTSVSGNDKTLRFWRKTNTSEKNNYSPVKIYPIATQDTGDMNLAEINSSLDDFGIWAVAGYDGKVRFFPQGFNAFSAHKNAILSLDFSPVTQVLATASNDATAKLWKLENGQFQNPVNLLRHQKGIYDVSFNQNGTKIATASQDKTAKIWTPQGETLHVLKDHNAAVNRARFSPDGKRIATSSDDKTIKIWTLDGELLVTLRGHEDGVNSISFHPKDSNILLSGSSDQTAILWDLTDLNIEALILKGCNLLEDSISTSQKICQ